MESRQTLHIRLARDADGYPPFDFEEVAAVGIGDHLFRLVSPPAFAHGLAAGDVVMIRHHPDIPGEHAWIESLVEAGGHSTFRVIGLGGRTPDEPRRLAYQFGCDVTDAPVDRMIAIDVPVEADVRSLYEALKTGRGSDWDLDVGVLSDEHVGQLGERFP
jgi:hypothetical protein